MTAPGEAVTVAAAEAGGYEDFYRPMLAELRGLERLAGTMLAQSFSDPDKPEVSRALAEQYAREAAAIRPLLKAWRLANGYPA